MQYVCIYMCIYIYIYIYIYISLVYTIYYILPKTNFGSYWDDGTQEMAKKIKIH